MVTITSGSPRRGPLFGNNELMKNMEAPTGADHLTTGVNFLND
jgi:hypothetical protein